MSHPNRAMITSFVESGHDYINGPLGRARKLANKWQERLDEYRREKQSRYEGDIVGELEQCRRELLGAFNLLEIKDGYTGDRHGHVVPLPGGHKARCGGPELCATCKAESEWEEQHK